MATTTSGTPTISSSTGIDTISSPSSTSDTITPTSIPTNTIASQSGGSGVTTDIYKIGSASSQPLTISYDMYSIPDKIEVYLDADTNPIATTGDFVSGNNTLTIAPEKLKGVSTVKVVVTGNLTTSTAWDYNVNYAGGISHLQRIEAGNVDTTAVFYYSTNFQTAYLPYVGELKTDTSSTLFKTVDADGAVTNYHGSFVRDSLNSAITTGSTIQSFDGADAKGIQQFSFSTTNSYDAVALKQAVQTDNTTAFFNLVFAGNDSIMGSPQDDVLSGFGGNDTIDGNGGNDRVFFSGKYADYQIMPTSANHVTVQNMKTNETEQLINITSLQFADKIILTSSITVAPNSPHTGSVTITDNNQIATPTVGDILTATNSLADTDGLGSLNYQWLSDGKPIADEIKSTHTLTTTDVGKTISVNVNYTDGKGYAESEASAATAKVVSATPPIIKLTAPNALVSNTSKINATNVTTTGDDKITSTIANLVGSSLDGGAGNDTLTFLDAGKVTIPANITNVETLQLADGSNNVDFYYNGGSLNENADISTINGGSGNDQITAYNYSSVHHLINGYNGNDIITFGGYNNTINGGDGNDLISASGGNGVISGGNGDDTISCFQQNDVISGGNGSDVFRSYFNQSGVGKPDTITDFTSGTDRFDFSNVNAFTGITTNIPVIFSGNQPNLNKAQAAITANANNLQIVYEQDTHILWADTNNDGVLDSKDLQINLSNNPTTLTAADVGAITLTASGTPSVADATLPANSAVRTLIGTANADTIKSNGLGDTITGGNGTDTITLGAGKDVVRYTATNATSLKAEGSDTVTSFATGSDKIQLPNALLGVTSSTLTDTVNTNNYFETAKALSTTAADLNGTSTATTAGIVVIGAATGVAGVDVYYTSNMNAATTANSTLIVHLTGINTAGIAATDFVLA